MLQKALNFLVNELNAYLDHIDIEAPSATQIELKHVLDDNGESNFIELAMCVVNIEEERINRSQEIYRDTKDGFERVNPELRLNLQVLIAANFRNNYDEALKYLSYVISYFQAKNVFDQQNSPGLDPGIEKLIVELNSLPFEQLNHMWGTLGAKYMPSVLYRVRMIVIQEENVMMTADPIKIVAENYGSI